MQEILEKSWIVQIFFVHSGKIEKDYSFEYGRRWKRRLDPGEFPFAGHVSKDWHRTILIPRMRP